MQKSSLSFGMRLCALFFLITTLVFADTTDSNLITNRRAELEKELAGLESQIDSYRKTIQDKQKQSTTLERDIAIIDAQIEKVKLEIKTSNLRISQLSQNIGQHSVVIGSLADKISGEKETLSELIRKTNEIDSNSLPEIILGYDNLSDFFAEGDSFELVQNSIQDSLKNISDAKSRTEKEKSDLEDKKAEQTDLKKIQEIENKKLASSEKDKATILKISKGEEKKYQQFLADSEKSAAKIRSQLFFLNGSPSIPFEKAYEYAKSASRATGIRPAFLLGIITEESNLGANVGTGNWKTDMHPTRDRPIFQQITQKLGLDPDSMPVSKKAWYGWGGAMGPAQFIPSTWILYEDKIAGLTGHNPPNPWDPQDAFMASAILLTENGAVVGNYNAERLAALRYLAGWKNASKSAYAFYGDDVMEFAGKYQNEIDIISR